MLRATAPAPVGQLAIARSHAADFGLEYDGCSGRALAAGETCQVRVRFQPGAAGARTAVLDGGSGVSVPLQGFSYGGRTRLELHSEPGDPVGGGRDLTFTPANAWIRGYAVGSQPGADLVRGGAGRDVVIGGRGRDRLDCGRGRDVAYVGPRDRARGCERIVRG